MRGKKITMVNPEQITARGWKGFKTKRAVENFATKFSVNRVWWRAPGSKKILLVDYNHFREIWQEWKKSTPTHSGTKRTYAKKSTSKRIYAKRTTSQRTYSRKPTARKQTTPSRTRRITTRRYTRY